MQWVKTVHSRVIIVIIIIISSSSSSSSSSSIVIILVLHTLLLRPGILDKCIQGLMKSNRT